MDEASLEEVGSGRAPVTEGWFAVNARDAAWMLNAAFGARCVFEARGPVLRGRPELTPRSFAQLGVTLQVLEPGRPSGLYHAETAQEGALVLAGECLLVVEEEERRLARFDFVHMPAGTRHCFVGLEERCLLLIVGARPPGRGVRYPRSALALAHDAGVETATDSPGEAYAPRPPWQAGRPARFAELPWGAV